MKPRFGDAILVLSLASNIALAYVIHRDRTPQAPPGPKVGEMVGTLTGFDDSGAKITIPGDSRGRPTVLYVFSQSCVWCERTMPALRTLIPKDSSHFRFVAVDISAPFAPSRPYLSANNLAFEASFHPDPETRTHIGAEGTPTILVVDTTGRVEKVFNGALIGTTLRSATEYLGFVNQDPNLTRPASSVAHAYRNGCVQDGREFSFGAIICWQQKAYGCERERGWQSNDSECNSGMYVAKGPPIQ